MRLVALVLPLLALAGCASDVLDPLPSGHGPRCASGTLHAEWVEPGLHAALEDAGTAAAVAPAEPHVDDAALVARWGTVGLIEVALQHEGDGRGDTASVSHHTWGGGGPLQLAVSLESRHDAEHAVALARELLERLGVPPAQAEPMVEKLRASFEPAPPGVANSIGAVPFKADVDWDALPERLFGPGEDPNATAHSTVRTLRADEWRLTLRPALLRIEERGIEIEVAKDDRVVAFVDLEAPSQDVLARERINATLVNAGFRPASYQDHSGAVAIC